MKNEQLYNETVDIILDAYNNGQLKYLDACGCFIGNIVAARMNYSGKYAAAWLICASPISLRRLPHSGIFMESKMSVDEFRQLGFKQIESTGYTAEEVDRMEGAFEAAKHVKRDEDGNRIPYDNTGLAGMKAALKVLAEIHETKEDTSIERLEKIHKEKYEEVSNII